VNIHVPRVQPEVIFTLGGLAVTNTILLSWLTLLVLLIFGIVATRNMKLVPSGLQNVAEAIVELLLGLAEQVAGSRARSFLPLIATLFLYILFANWLGILPGVGSWTYHDRITNADVPWLRSPNSDLSLTAGMAIIVFFAVQIVGMRANIGAYFKKFLWPPLIGQLEIISEFSRPLSLALRLFGNILAGFILVEIMLQLVPPVLPVVFLGLELGVGLIQALIFAILTLAFLSLASSHGSEEHGAHAEH
jgi:F-type H+-transporting ATPase subunit a